MMTEKVLGFVIDIPRTTADIARRAGISNEEAEGALKNLFKMARIAREKRDGHDLRWYIPEATNA